MRNQKSTTERFAYVQNAFKKDNFVVKNLNEDDRFKHCQYVTPQGYVEYQGQIGVLGEHAHAKNTVTGEPKKAFYLEGTNVQMGFLLGLMAEPDVSKMVNDYIDKVVFYFFHAEKLANTIVGYLIGRAFVDIMEKATKVMEQDIPQEYKDEMQGIYEGCKAINDHTKVNTKKLRVLNVGVDCLLSHIYTGKVFIDGIQVASLFLKVPHMCHAFSICGDIVENNGHLFGRNFMFPTADVWQDTACVIIYNPEGQGMMPIVSQTAPGMVGSPAAMNINGAAIGVDMSPTMFCNPHRPGLNSLMLNRDCMDRCATTQDVVNRMIDAPRGVSWLYPVADGETDKACIVETGYNTGDDPFPYFDFINPDWFKEQLPDENFINNMREKYHTPAPQKGLMARWNDYTYPVEYTRQFNANLWKAYNQKFLPQLSEKAREFVGVLEKKFPFLKDIIQFVAKDILKGFTNVQHFPFYEGDNGFIDNMFTAHNCPGPFYFAPQRGDQSNLLVVSNHNITPEMRLTAMSEWITFLAGGDLNDLQWRYDILGHQLKQACAGNQKIDKDTAWRIINNLSTDPSYHYFTYYNRGMMEEWQKCQVQGSVTLCDLKSKSFTTLFGYYGDDHITITLPNYIDN
ncbi:MAG: hypothetical protein GTO45_40575 [Candidatus Aminicenantes bacterium]|nr:hypothetical protein [Candidatus Aminicenantes bacterium]NIM84902.1 hypothetical protein [Candidatus Aminicenantes bacterium]NIN24413.1 hypothetical protein [Candidatus Aminicenantes bacterium]NIN48177.1 hypothetical protein [Candidatus Aminicenantes bacterium]NIN91080.1 hypothetical protein [Candidatus Aminicenantes bacterium]